MGKLTTRVIENAGPRNKPYKLVDGEGLQLRIGTDGRKTWLVRYVVDRTSRQYSLPTPYGASGGAGYASLKDARDAARNIRALARQGIDYQVQLEQERARRAAADAVERAARTEAERLQAAQVARPTVTQLLERWQRVELQQRKDGGKEVRRSFERDVLPVFGNVAIQDVTRAMVARVLDTAVERGSPVIARNLLSTLRKMFTFAMKRELIDADPTAILKRSDYGKRNERERTLSEAEIQELVRKLPVAGLQKATELAIWLMLSTCCRVGELCKARWVDVDFDAARWRIPAENAKNGKVHVVLLSDFSVQQFRRLHAESGDGQWCFPAAMKPDSHVCTKSISKQIHDRQRLSPLRNRSKATRVLLTEGGTWTPHDLRRTGATLMGALGVRPDVIEKCLNHVEQNKLVRIYQRQELNQEKREAWRVLGERLQLLITGYDHGPVAHRTAVESVVAIAPRGVG